MIVLPAYRRFPGFTVSFWFSMQYSTAFSEILWSCLKVASGTWEAGRGFLAFVLPFPRFLAVGLGGAAVGDEGAEAAGVAILARGAGVGGRSCGGAGERRPGALRVRAVPYAVHLGRSSVALSPP